MNLAITHRWLLVALPLTGCSAFFSGYVPRIQLVGSARVPTLGAGITVEGAASPVATPVAAPAAAVVSAPMPVVAIRVRIVGAQTERVVTVSAGSITLAAPTLLTASTVLGGTLVATETSGAGGVGEVLEVTGGTVVLEGGRSVSVGRGSITIGIGLHGAPSLRGSLAVAAPVADAMAPVVAAGDPMAMPGAYAPVDPASGSGGATAVPIVSAPVIDAEPAVVTTGSTPVAVVPSAPAGPVAVVAAPAPTVAVTTTTVAAPETPAAITVTARVSVRQVAVVGDAGVVGGGAIVLQGVPAIPGLVVLDGSLRLGDGSMVIAHRPGTAGRWIVSGGSLLIGSPDGHRWRAEINAGHLNVAQPATPSVRVTVSVSGPPAPRWSVSGGEVHLGLLADLGGGFANEIAPPPAPPPAISARAIAALDALVHSAPAGSVEALRLEAAVALVRSRTQEAQPTIYTTTMTGRSVVVVVDVSYSMNDPDPAAMRFATQLRAQPTKLDVARAELVKFLSSLPGDVTVSVVAFSSAQNVLWAAPRAVDDAALNEAIRWVSGLRVVDETHPVEALQTAAAMPVDQVVMVTDGRPTFRDTENGLMALARQMPALHMHLDVVGVGADQDAQYLLQLAGAGGGHARQN